MEKMETEERKHPYRNSERKKAIIEQLKEKQKKEKAFYTDFAEAPVNGVISKHLISNTGRVTQFTAIIEECPKTVFGEIKVLSNDGTKSTSYNIQITKGSIEGIVNLPVEKFDRVIFFIPDENDAALIKNIYITFMLEY